MGRNRLRQTLSTLKSLLQAAGAGSVLQADRLGLDYGLRLPGVEIAPNNGPVHRRRCLEALALC